ncbi:MAG: hypothetical protein OEZ20_02295 [candidate division WOR-3 bacterium]|nr:hypothetical protein [candidate division WOR-3 bacterium]
MPDALRQIIKEERWTNNALRHTLHARFESQIGTSNSKDKIPSPSTGEAR